METLDEERAQLIRPGRRECLLQNCDEADAIRFIGAEEGGVGEAILIDISFCAADVRCGRGLDLLMPGGARAGKESEGRSKPSCQKDAGLTGKMMYVGLAGARRTVMYLRRRLPAAQACHLTECKSFGSWKLRREIVMKPVRDEQLTSGP